MPPRLRALLIRVALLAGFIALVAFVYAFGARVGLGEWALILALFAVVIGIESIRYVVRQFLQGYRGEKRRKRR